MTIRHVTGYIAKAASKDTLPTFVMSDETVDRVGDIIKADGWQLDDFRKNSPALFAHDHEKIVGRWENVRVDGKRLLGELRTAGTNLGRMVAQLIDEGMLRAVSVGFVPLEHEPINKKEPYGGWLIKKASLLECSLVSVPANQNAILLSKRLGLSDAERRLVFAKAVSGNPRIQRATAALEAARQALRK